MYFETFVIKFTNIIFIAL